MRQRRIQKRGNMLKSLIIYVFLIGFGTQCIAANPVLDIRYSVTEQSGNNVRLRIELRCSSPGKHILNSGDFYLNYNPQEITYNTNPVRGKDYIWGDHFDPAIHPFFNLAKVIYEGFNPEKPELNLLDIAVIDSGFKSTGALLDSGKWIPFVDILLHIKKPGNPSQLILEPVRSGNTLIGIFESFVAVPTNFDEGEGWDTPFVIKLE